MPSRDIHASRPARIRSTLAPLCAALALLAGCDDPDLLPADADEAAADEADEAVEADEANDADETIQAALPGQAIPNAMPFGTMCQADFQNNWQTTLGWTWNRCGGFNSVFSQIATQVFYYNLVGLKPYIETTWDAWGADSVEFLYMSTHGGAFNGTAAYAMWDQNQLAYTTSMRFDVLSMLSTYACKTLQLDGQVWSRWFPAMAGGLSITAGSHGYVYDSYYTDDTGSDYAANLTYQWSVKDAWIDGLWDAYTTQDVALLAAGSNYNDCTWRLHGINPYNRLAFPRRRDGEIGSMCWVYLTE